MSIHLHEGQKGEVILLRLPHWMRNLLHLGYKQVLEVITTSDSRLSCCVLLTISSTIRWEGRFYREFPPAGQGNECRQRDDDSCRCGHMSLGSMAGSLWPLTSQLWKGCWLFCFASHLTEMSYSSWLFIPLLCSWLWLCHWSQWQSELPSSLHFGNWVETALDKLLPAVV